MNPRDRLQYALYLQRLHELFVIKENIAFQYQNAHYNKAAEQIDKVVDKCLDNNIKAVVDGTHNLETPNLDHVISQALSSQQKMLVKTEDRYIQSAVEQNTKEFTRFIQNRIEKENYSLQAKIQKEYEKKKYKGMPEEQAKKLISEKFKDSARKRSKNIVKDALHTNQSQISWTYNVNNGMKYKVWMNGQSKSGVRSWHIKSKIQPVEIDDFFDIFGPTGHASMMYPGDLNGGAENVANCKCWLYYTNIAPSNLKKKGTIQINPNVNLTNENNETFSANTETKSKGKKTSGGESTSTNKKEGIFTKIKNKFSNIKNRFTSRNPKVKSEKYNLNSIQEPKKKDRKNPGLKNFNSSQQNKPSKKSSKNISKNQLKRKIKVLADKKDVNKLLNLFTKLDETIKNPSLEYGFARTKSGRIVKLERDENNHLKIPEDIQKEGREKGLHTLIHNHPQGTSPLASPEDVRSFAEYGSKYGISKNELGTFRVKNNNGPQSNEIASKIEEEVLDIKTKIKEDFQEHLKNKGINWIEYKKKNKNKYKKECLEFTNEHIEKYVPWYQDALNKYGMEVTFIK